MKELRKKFYNQICSTLFTPRVWPQIGQHGFRGKIALFVKPPLAFERFGFSGFLDGFGCRGFLRLIGRKTFVRIWTSSTDWKPLLLIDFFGTDKIVFEDENFSFFNSFPHLCRRRYQAKVSCLSQLIYWMSNYNVPPFNIQPIFNSGS